VANATTRSSVIQMNGPRKSRWKFMKSLVAGGASPC
jgi:hypothetical protein